MGIEVVAEPMFCVVFRLLCMIGIVSIHWTSIFHKRMLNDLLVCQTDQSRMNDFEKFMGNIAGAHSLCLSFINKQ
jgi:hypothetical protein